MSTTRTTLRTTGVAVRAMLVFTLVLGVGYTLLVTGDRPARAAVAGERLDGAGQRRPDGRLGTARAVVHGCRRHALAEYFQSRPSAAGDGYDGGASSG